MLMSELTNAIYAAGYDFNTVQEVRRYLVERDPKIGEAIFGQPMSTAQADPMIPDKVGLRILDKLNIPVEVP